MMFRKPVLYKPGCSAGGGWKAYFPDFGELLAFRLLAEGVEMSPESSGKLVETARRNSQAVLFDLLKGTGDVAFTLLESARLQVENNPEKLPAILDKIDSALNTIRYFMPRLDDVQALADIGARNRSLEAEMAELDPGRRGRGKLIAFPMTPPPRPGPASEAARPAKIWKINAAAS